MLYKQNNVFLLAENVNRHGGSFFSFIVLLATIIYCDFLLTGHYLLE